MRTRFVLTIAAAVLGGAAVVALGLSLLAAHRTLQNALADGRPLGILGSAELRAEMQAMKGGVPPTTAVPCLGRIPSATRGNGSGTAQLTLVSNARTELEAACLQRHGFLSSRGLSTVERALRAKPASPVSSLFPLGAQVIPTTFTVTAWIVVVLGELALLGRLVIVARRRGIATSTG